MFQLKQSAINWIPIVITDDSTGAGVTGLTFNAAGMSFKVAKTGLAAATKTLSAPDWVEIGNGGYWVRLSAGECDTVGAGDLVSLFNSNEAHYVFEVRANTEAEVFTRLGAPTSGGGTIVTDIAAVGGGGGGGGDALESTSQAILAAVNAGNSSLAIIRGLMGADSYEDSFEYNGPSGALSASRLRTYTSAANAATHGATGLIKTYTFTFGYTGSNLTSVQITEA